MKETVKTSRTAGYLEKIFRALNVKYFNGELEEPIITIQSTPRAYGHVTVAKAWQRGDTTSHELNIGAGTLARPIENVVATTLHECVHLWNLQNGIQDCSRGGAYHNKKFKEAAEARDLKISYDPRVGWSITEPTDALCEFILEQDVYSDQYTGQQYVFSSDDVLHFKTSHTFNGLVGESVQAILASTVQGQQASQDFLNDLYENGLTARAVLEYTGDLSAAGQNKLRESFEQMGNGPANAGRILPVPLGFKLTPMDIKLTDAQYLELKKYGALQLAAAFGIKPNQLNDYERGSYANSEQQTIAFQVETMQYTIKQYEEEMAYKLLDGPADRRRVKFNEKALLRTDSKTQMEILKTAVEGSIYSPNEARRYVDKRAAPGGDKLLANGGMIALEQMGAQYGVDKTEKGGTENAPI